MYLLYQYHKGATQLRKNPLLYRPILAELFDISCATGSLARRGPSSSSYVNLDDDSDTGVSSTPSAAKRQAQASYNSEEKESKRARLTVVEGVNRVAEEMKQFRIIK